MAKIRDPLPFAEHFGIDPVKLERIGILNPVLNVDTKLFIEQAPSESILRTSSNFLKRASKREMLLGRQRNLDSASAKLPLRVLAMGHSAFEEVHLDQS
jgi:hypothetical protein